jgi:hypothetical protein
MEKAYHRQAAKAAKCLNWDAKGVSWRFRKLLGVLPGTARQGRCGDLAVNTDNVYSYIHYTAILVGWNI